SLNRNPLFSLMFGNNEWVEKHRYSFHLYSSCLSLLSISAAVFKNSDSNWFLNAPSFSGLISLSIKKSFKSNFVLQYSFRVIAVRSKYLVYFFSRMFIASMSSFGLFSARCIGINRLEKPFA